MPRYPILMYHQIDRIPPRYRADGSRAKFRSLVVSPAAFAAQMWLIKALGFRGVSMGELMPYLRGHKTGRVVGITFDDGYLNNLQYALPVLERSGFSATCYLVTGRMGQGNDWDSGVVDQKPLLDAAACRQWMAAGQEIASHTADHVHLTQISDELAHAQMRQSYECVAALTHNRSVHFCYPYGLYTEKHVQMARALYASATTTRAGYASVNSDPMQLPRFGVFKNTTLWGLAGILLRAR